MYYDSRKKIKKYIFCIKWDTVLKGLIYYIIIIRIFIFNQTRFAESGSMAKEISQIENLPGGSFRQRAVVRHVNFQVSYARPATTPVKVYLILISLDEN